LSYKKLSIAIVATLFIPLIGTAAESRSHQTGRVGAYLISLYDFDFARGTFGADLWLWSNCHNKERKPLEVMVPFQCLGGKLQKEFVVVCEILFCG
jgi:hypothetical protein